MFANVYTKRELHSVPLDDYSSPEEFLAKLCNDKMFMFKNSCSNNLIWIPIDSINHIEFFSEREGK